MEGLTRRCGRRTFWSDGDGPYLLAVVVSRQCPFAKTQLMVHSKCVQLIVYEVHLDRPDLIVTSVMDIR